MPQKKILVCRLLFQTVKNPDIITLFTLITRHIKASAYFSIK